MKTKVLKNYKETMSKRPKGELLNFKNVSKTIN